MIQVVVNAQANWSRETKDELAKALDRVFREIPGGYAGELSVWFHEYGPLDVFVGPDPAVSEGGDT